MARARVVTPPPQDYIPEPLVTIPVVVDSEAIIEQQLLEESIREEGSYTEELIVEPTPVEIEQDRIAQEKYEQLQQEKLAGQQRAKETEELLAEAKRIIENPPVVTETVIETVQVTDTKLIEELRILKKENQKLQKQKAQVIETVQVADPGLVEELELLRKEKETLQREKEAAEKAREDQIVKMRQQATAQKGSQLNMVQARKPSLVSRIKDFFKRRRIQLATIPRANFEQAIINQASVAVPKMLDEIEKMHESLTILEELLAKHKERQKIKD